MRHNRIVNPIVILAKLHIQPIHHRQAASYYSAIDKALRSVDGYEGVGLWQSPTRTSEFIALYHYASLAAAEKGLEVVSEEGVLSESMPSEEIPADVRRVEIFKKSGRREPNAKVGDFLSISFRLADPGYGERLMEEIDRIIDEISYIPGFLGAEYGRNQSLEDEIIGIVSWDSREAFASSVPPGTLYEVNLYQRVV